MNMFMRHSKIHSGGLSKDINSASEKTYETNCKDAHVGSKRSNSISNKSSANGSTTTRKSIVATIADRIRSSEYLKV